MEHLGIGVRILFLAISLYGLLRWVSGWVRVELAIGLLFAGIGSAVFLAGLVNIMREVSWCIFAFGLLQAGRSVLNRRKQKLTHCFGFLFAAFGAVFFLFLLYGSKFVFYDNFIHWGIVTKTLAQTDYFPSLATINLSHPSYPVGSACFLYYFMEIAGISSEWFQMWAQAVLMTGMLAGLFAFSKGKRQNLLTAAGIVILLCSNVDFVDIPVDTLLPAAALGALSFCIYYREEMTEKLIFLLPYGIFLLSIKNSALLFAVLLFACAFLFMERTPENLKNWTLAVTGSFAPLYLWNRHVEQTFGTSISRHSMSLENYQQVFETKTAQENLETVRSFLAKFGSSLDQAATLLLAMVLVFLYQKYCLKNAAGETKKLLIFSLISYAVYQVGLLGVYLFSMPVGEALVTAQYVRYHQTILIFCGGLLLIAALRGKEDTAPGIRQKALRLGICAMVPVLLCVSLKPNWAYYTRQDLENTDRARFDALIEEYGIEKRGSYLLVTRDRNGLYYLTHMARYLLEPSWVVTGEPAELEEAVIMDFDYVILFDETEEGRAFFLEAFGEEERDVVKINR